MILITRSHTVSAGAKAIHRRLSQWAQPIPKTHRPRADQARPRGWLDTSHRQLDPPGRFRRPCDGDLGVEEAVGHGVCVSRVGPERVITGRRVELGHLAIDDVLLPGVGIRLLDPRSVHSTNPVTNSARVGDADASVETTSAAAPARRNLGAARNAAAGPQHSLIVAVAVHHPDSIERRVRPCRSLSFALVGDLVA
jgi:hypothetical protein